MFHFDFFGYSAEEEGVPTWLPNKLDHKSQESQVKEDKAGPKSEAHVPPPLQHLVDIFGNTNAADRGTNEDNQENSATQRKNHKTIETDDMTLERNFYDDYFLDYHKCGCIYICKNSSRLVIY